MEKSANNKVTASKKATPKRPKTSPEMSLKLHEFFVAELKDIYWAEKHLTKALPKMEKAATAMELKKAFADHLAQTKQHVSRLSVFAMLNKKPVAKKCEAMAG
ncbi:hypothetical protein BH10BAC2_BH10BAC2_39710 [soil metagenome]